MKSLISICSEKLRHSSKDKYTVAFVKCVLQNSFSLKDLENEVNNSLNLFAWQTQIAYFNLIQDAVQNNASLKNITFPFAKELLTEFQFFIEDAIDKILEEFENLADDKGYQIDVQSVKIDELKDIFTEVIEYDNWKNVFEASSTKLIQKAVDFFFVEQTTSTILAYIHSLRNVNLPSSESELDFTLHDKSLKQALTEYNSANQSKQKTQFLMTELHSIIHKVIAFGDVNNNILKTAVKFGYPLPLSAAKIIAIAIDNFLTKSKFINQDFF